MPGIIPSVLALLVAALSLTAGSAQAGDDPKVDCANAMSTVEMNFCGEKELDVADAAMNEIYKKAIAAIPGLASDKPYDAKSWEEALRGSQRSWVAFRDAECKTHLPMFWSGGTGTTAEVLGCMTELTKNRTEQLKNRYEQN